MTCNACGDKPKKTCDNFTRAVIELNNPETLVLLRKVVIPASMGDDTEVVPAIGKYRNVILVYEANDHIYLYSSDGIPTAIESNVPQEVLNRIATLETDVTTLERGLETETGARERADGVLQQEINDLKNSPDVVDIVATYAALMEYDTSSLGDKDVIRVLVDETHEGQSDYYRWSASTETWTFIGTVGDYYTKTQVDTLLSEKQDELIPGENITIEDESGSLVISATDTTYTFDSTPTAGSTNPVTSEGIKNYVDTKSVTFKPFPASVVTTGTTQQFMNSILALHPDAGMAYLGTVSLSDMPAGLLQEEVEVYVYSDYVVYCIMRSTDVSPYAWWCASYNYQGWRPVNTDTTYSAGSGLSLTGTTFSVDTTTIPTKTEMDLALADKQDLLTAGDNITIEDESGDLVISATDTTYTAGTGITINNGVISATSTGPTVVQTTGTSTTDVMSQNAVTSMLFADPANKTKVQIGSSQAGANNAVTINGEIGSGSDGSIAVGDNGNKAKIGVQADKTVVIGSNAKAAKYSSASVILGKAAGAGDVTASGSSNIVVIGASAAVNGTGKDGAIALGAFSSASAQGEMNIGSSYTWAGYNNSNYRLISGVYDGQSAHDAVTKGQMDTELSYKQDELTAGTGISIAEESGALVISATGADIATINAQDWSALWQ